MEDWEGSPYKKEDWDTLMKFKDGGELTTINIKYHDDDWSVWLDRSNALLPCLLISKSTDGNALTTQTNTVAWKAKPNITANTFRFVAPKAHKKD